MACALTMYLNFLDSNDRKKEFCQNAPDAIHRGAVTNSKVATSTATALVGTRNSTLR